MNNAFNRLSVETPPIQRRGRRPARRGRSLVQALTFWCLWVWGAGEAQAAPAPEKAPRGTLAIRIREAGGGPNASPLPCRAHVRDAQGRPVRAPGLPFWDDHFVFPGAVRVELVAGRASVVIERGPEYRRIEREIEIEPGKTHSLEGELKRWIDLAARGWYSGETHVHRPPRKIALHLEAEDLHVAGVITRWNRRCVPLDPASEEEPVIRRGTARIADLTGVEDERGGGALIYFRLRAPPDLSRDAREYPPAVKHLLEAARDPRAWIEIEKPFWWDAPVWAATGKVRGIGLAINHMCRSRMYETEAWGRPRDARRLPPPRGNGFYTQELYYRFLNCGFRLAPAAGSASGVLPNPVGYNRAYVRIEGPFSLDAWWEGLAAGRSFVTNGPVLLVEANGRDPGTVFRAAEGGAVEIRLDVRAGGNDLLESVEIVRDGRIVERIRPEARDVWLVPEPLRFTKSGWFLVRAIAQVPETFRFASTAPFYVEIGKRTATIHREDVEFFLRWIDERIEALEKADRPELRAPGRREEVLATQRAARAHFEKLLAEGE